MPRSAHVAVTAPSPSLVWRGSTPFIPSRQPRLRRSNHRPTIRTGARLVEELAKSSCAATEGWPGQGTDAR